MEVIYAGKQKINIFFFKFIFLVVKNIFECIMPFDMNLNDILLFDVSSLISKLNEYNYLNLIILQKLFLLGANFGYLVLLHSQPKKTLYLDTLHYVDVIVYIVQLLVPSYAPFSSVAERCINLT